MSKTTAPLLSFDARGQIAKTQVYSSWKGRSYARRYTIPAYTNSLTQQSTRSAFRWLQAVYKLMAGLAQAPWKAYAKGQVLTDRNGWTKANVANLRVDTDLSNLVLSPGSGGGLAAAAIAAVGSAATVTVGMTAPVLPTGWTITDAVAVAITDQDPQTEVEYASYAAHDATDPYSVVINPVPAGDYVIGAWFVFQKPDGSTAYGPSISDTATAS